MILEKAYTPRVNGQKYYVKGEINCNSCNVIYEHSYITHISLDFLFYILLIRCKLYAAAVISL